jgi:dihydrofolate reductase
MPKIVNSTYISLDGVIEAPHTWPSLDVTDARAERIQTELLLASDGVVMGRRTYEGFAPAWMSRSGDPYSDKINTMPKYVVSSTLTDPEWPNTIVIGAEDPVAEIARLDGPLVQYGFGQLSFALMEAGLLAELRLWVHPFIVGRGGPEDLLYRDTALKRFTLSDVTTLESGIVILTLQGSST